MPHGPQATARHQTISTTGARQVEEVLRPQTPGIHEAPGLPLRVLAATVAIAPRGVGLPLGAQHEVHTGPLEEAAAPAHAPIRQQHQDPAQTLRRQAAVPLGPKEGAVGARHIVGEGPLRGWRRDVVIHLDEPGAPGLPDLLPRHLPPLAVEGGHAGQLRRGEVCGVEAPGQAQGIQHQAPHEAVEALAGHPLHHGANHPPRQVGVLEVGPGGRLA